MKDQTPIETEPIPEREEVMDEVCQKLSALFKTEAVPHCTNHDINGCIKVYVPEIVFDKTQTREFKQILKDVDGGICIIPSTDGSIIVSADMKNVRERVDDI